MAKQSLLTMSVDALLKLRDDIGDVLTEKAEGLRRQLQALGGSDKPQRGRPKGASKLPGKKAAVKYRDPATGETWSGRGGTARWVVAYEKQGRKRDEFLVEASAKAPKKAGKRK